MSVKLINQFLIFCITMLMSGFAFSQSVISQPDVRKYNLALGKKVFTENCIKCHGADTIEQTTNAPQLGNVSDWQNRISMPVDNLVRHAIDGHEKMPPKGGFKALTERHVAAAVAYVVDQSRRMIITYGGKLPPDMDNLCQNANVQDACTKKQLDNAVLLNLYWLLTQ